MNFTPQPTHLPASQASVGNRQRRPTLQKEACCCLAWGRLPPLAQEDILAGGQGVARTALHPLRAGTVLISASAMPAGTTSHTDLERNTLVWFSPHTPDTSPTDCGWVPHSGSQKCKQKTCFRLRSSHLSQEASHLTWAGGGEEWQNRSFHHLISAFSGIQ